MGSLDVSMSEAPPLPRGGRWRNGVMDNLVDALRDIDHDYASPQLKHEVEKLIEEEMRNNTKRLAGFLADLPTVRFSGTGQCLRRNTDGFVQGNPKLRSICRDLD